MTITYIHDRPACAPSDKVQAAASDVCPGGAAAADAAGLLPSRPLPSSASQGLPVLIHFEPRVAFECSRPLLHLPQLPGAPLLGSLYVTDKMLYWYSDELKRGIAVDYPSVGIHAICREPDLYSPAPCIYCQLDGDDFDENNVEQPTEVRFVPENSESVDDVYQALSHCASLHPDRDSTGDDSEGADDAPTVYFADGEPDVSRDEDALITDANAGDVQLTPEGEATMGRLEAMLLESEDDGHQR